MYLGSSLRDTPYDLLICPHIAIYHAEDAYHISIVINIDIGIIIFVLFNLQECSEMSVYSSAEIAQHPNILNRIQCRLK